MSEKLQDCSLSDDFKCIPLFFFCHFQDDVAVKSEQQPLDFACPLSVRSALKITLVLDTLCNEQQGSRRTCVLDAHPDLQGHLSRAFLQVDESVHHREKDKKKVSVKLEVKHENTFAKLSHNISVLHNMQMFASDMTAFCLISSNLL